MLLLEEKTRPRMGSTMKPHLPCAATCAATATAPELGRVCVCGYSSRWIATATGLGHWIAIRGYTYRQYVYSQSAANVEGRD